MTFELEDLDVTFDALVSHASATGYFDRVHTHEPKNAPGHGLTAALMLQSLTPVAFASGLAATSARVTFTLRIYTHMLQEPADEIDRYLLRATAGLMTSLSANFALDVDSVRNIELLGGPGTPGLTAQAAYLTQSGQVYRVMDITIPIVFNDAFPQEA